MARGQLITGLFLLMTALPAGGYERGERLPVEYFAALPEVSHMALAPSGQRVAAAYHIEGEAIVISRDPTSEAVTHLFKAPTERFHINWLRWASNDRLLVSARVAGERNDVKTLETRLLSIAADGSDLRALVRPGRQRFQPQLQDQVVDLLPGEPDHVLLALDTASRGASAVYRVNVKTAGRRKLTPELEGVRRWLTDAQHRVRVAVRQAGTRLEVLVRGPKQRAFETLWRHELFSEDRITPLGFGEDPQQLYVEAYVDGYLGIYRVNLAEPDALEPVLRRSGRDVRAQLLRTGSGAVIGLMTGDGELELWTPAFRALERGIEQAFPTRSTLLLDLSADGRFYLLLATSDRDAGTYYLGDRELGTVSPLASRYPKLTAELLLGQRVVSFEARDGRTIEGFLTLPADAGNGPLPAVVLPHGGPVAQDGIGFDYWSEFLGNRGYAVLKLNFRGSTGYGIEFLREGLGAWGLEMQDDIEDAARWLAASGTADPEHICVVGGSYGGYAALMATILSPDIFRCAVSFAGVSDLEALLRSARRFRDDEVARTMVGTRALATRSPLARAAEIRAPVLLAHGSEDRLVPVSQSRRLHRALEREGISHDYLELPAGDHYLSQERNRLALFRAMEAFLERHLARDLARAP